MAYLKNCFTWACIVAVALIVGCKAPECRKVEPLEDVEKELVKKIKKQLGEIDATREQRNKTVALARGLMPRYEALRRQTTPKMIALLREFQLPTPNRERILSLILALSTQLRQFSYDLIERLIAVNEILTPAQRSKLLKKQLKPKKPFEGSWMIDRTLDLFLLQINATREQKKLTVQLKDELIRRSQPLQKELERLRMAMIKEIGRENPNPESLRANVDAFREAVQAFVPKVLAYYLAWRDKLKPDQVALINSYIKRFEPCDISRGAPTPEAPAESPVAANP